MIQHHVYFYLKEEYKTAESRTEFEKGMDLCKNIPCVAGGDWGLSAGTPEDHNAYQVHPDHDVFVNACKDFWKDVKIMDVEL